MIQIIKNPYQIIGGQFASGLTFIESNLKQDMTFDELNELVYNFVQPKYFPNSNFTSRFTISFRNVRDALLDIEVLGGAYFIVKLPDANIAYTKAKKFIVNQEKLLSTSDSDYILQGTDLVGPPYDINISSNLSEILILENGEIYSKSIITPQTLDFAAQVAVATFINPAGLTDLGNGYYAESPGSGVPTIGVPQGDGDFEFVTVLLKNPMAQPDQMIYNVIKSTGSNAVLDFTNNKQVNSCYYINLMINGLTEIPIESIGKFLENVQENIMKSGLSDMQIARCYMAVASALAAYDYWMNAISNTGNNWYAYNFFNAAETSNRASIPYWVAAAISGVALGSSYDNNLQLNLNPKAMQMAGTLMGGLTLASAMVMYKLVPNI